MLIYLDSSAVVKLCRSEDETDALLAHLLRHHEGVLVSSALATVEVCRVLVREELDPDAVMNAGGWLLSPPMLTRPIVTFEVSLGVLHDARSLPPAVMRSLDAIHVATARLLGEVLDHVITYDRLMLQAARAAGLTVRSPGRDDLTARADMSG